MKNDVISSLASSHSEDVNASQNDFSTTTEDEAIDIEAKEALKKRTDYDAVSSSASSHLRGFDITQVSKSATVENEVIYVQMNDITSSQTTEIDNLSQVREESANHIVYKLS